MPTNLLAPPIAPASNDSSPAVRPQFWQRFSLAELNAAEWEALCDGCGACCLIKLQDDDTGEVEYTDVACQLLDCQTGACRHYPTRHRYVPDCIALDLNILPTMDWLPATCAYKRLYRGLSLPDWHHLITGDRALSLRQMQAANVSVAGRCVSETQVDEWEQEQRVIRWIKQ